MNYEERMAGIRKHQLLQIDMIRIFVDICEKENLSYFMLGGTLLGAVRHKGFIPWDDDVDFGMPRPDYERFLRIAPGCLPEGLKTEPSQPILDSNYPYYYSRIVSRDDKLIVKIGNKDRVEGVWLDIFPLDGMPNGRMMLQIHKYYLLFRRAMYQYSHFSEYVNLTRTDRVWYERILVFLGKTLPVEKMLSKQKEWIRLDNALNRFPYEESDYLLNLMGGYKFKEMFRKEVFGNGACYEFEGMQLRGPQDYDFYLTQLYGDYMVPPPEAERNKHNTELQEE